MKRTLPIITFFVLLFVFSKWGPALPFSVSSQNKGEPMVVSADAKVTVTPDIAKVSLGIEESGSSLKTVQESVNKKSQALVAQIKKLGIDEKDIKTSSYNIYPENDYQANPPKITGYRVSTNYIVTVKDFDKVNDLLTLATQNGANLVGGVSFEISDDIREGKLNEARREASEKAKTKANGLASAAGITLGKIINISEGVTGDTPRPYLMDTKAILNVGGGPESMPQPDIQPGQTDLTVSVSLSFEIR